MSWADRTLWMKCEHGFQAVTTDDQGPPTEEILEDQGIDAIRAKDFAPCNECDHIGPCMDSLWNEGLRMGGPQDNEGSISMAHTCSCCDEKVLTVLSGGQDKKVIPDDCPRWNPRSGSAWDCEGCKQQRREIEKAHPKYAQKMADIKEAAEAFTAAIKAPDEFTKKRNIKKMAGKAVEGMMPDFSDYEDQDAFFMAQEVWMEMLKAIKNTVPDFWEKEVSQNAPLLAHFTQGGLDYLYHSLLRNPGGAEKVIEELVLFLTDTGAFARHWARFTVPEKKFNKRNWQGVIRRVWLSYEGQV